MIYREDILSEIEAGLDNLLAEAPERLSEAARKEIKEEFVSYTQSVLDSLSSEELQSSLAHESFIKHTLAHAKRRVRQR